MDYAISEILNKPEYDYSKFMDYLTGIPINKEAGVYGGEHSHENYKEGRDIFEKEGTEHFARTEGAKEFYKYQLCNTIDDIIAQARQVTLTKVRLGAIRDAVIDYNKSVEEGKVNSDMAFAATGSHIKLVNNMLGFLNAPDMDNFNHQGSDIWMPNTYRLRGSAATGKTTTLPAYFIMAYQKMRPEAERMNEIKMTVVIPSSNLEEKWTNDLSQVAMHLKNTGVKGNGLNIQFISFDKMIAGENLDKINSDFIFVDEMTLLKTVRYKDY